MLNCLKSNGGCTFLHLVLVRKEDYEKSKCIGNCPSQLCNHKIADNYLLVSLLDVSRIIRLKTMYFSFLFKL